MLNYTKTIASVLVATAYLVVLQELSVLCEHAPANTEDYSRPGIGGSDVAIEGIVMCEEQEGLLEESSVGWLK